MHRTSKAKSRCRQGRAPYVGGHIPALKAVSGYHHFVNWLWIRLYCILSSLCFINSVSIISVLEENISINSAVADASILSFFDH